MAHLFSGKTLTDILKKNKDNVKETVEGSERPTLLHMLLILCGLVADHLVANIRTCDLVV